LGRKGEKKHLKRKPAPSSWPIHRKELIWTTKPVPGAHPVSSCIPLLLIVREILGFAKTRREAKMVVSQGKIWVDGRPQREERFPVGLMDVVLIPEIERAYRVLPSRKGLTLHPIGKDETGFKLCKIEGKSLVKDGHVQLNLHDGGNTLIEVKDPQKPEEDIYKVLDTLKVGVPAHEVLGHMRMSKGAPVIVTGGKNAGRHGRVVVLEEEKGQKRRESIVTIEDEKGRQFQTTLGFTFVVGDAKPCISLPEVD